jgi:hypothetical protein
MKRRGKWEIETKNEEQKARFQRGGWKEKD